MIVIISITSQSAVQCNSECCHSLQCIFFITIYYGDVYSGLYWIIIE